MTNENSKLKTTVNIFMEMDVWKLKRLNAILGKERGITKT